MQSQENLKKVAVFGSYVRGEEKPESNIEHYQKIIVALSETEKIMREIDKTVQY